jgi:hypothetical protein
LAEEKALGLLHIRRSKHGINPECIIGHEFAAMLHAFEGWHRTRFPASPWYFPNTLGDVMYRQRVYEYLVQAAKRLELPPVTPHGFRSFYVTKRRSDGATDPSPLEKQVTKPLRSCRLPTVNGPRTGLGATRLAGCPSRANPRGKVGSKRTVPLTTD